MKKLIAIVRLSHSKLCWEREREQLEHFQEASVLKEGGKAARNRK